MSNSPKSVRFIIQAIAEAILPNLKMYHSLAIHDRSPAEAAEVKLISEQVRQLRKSAKFSREGMAMKTGLDKELIVLVENGYGDKETAEFVLAAAQTLK